VELSKVLPAAAFINHLCKVVSVGGGCWEERVDVERCCYLKVKSVQCGFVGHLRQGRGGETKMDGCCSVSSSRKFF
jgi:hypothetical protein